MRNIDKTLLSGSMGTMLLKLLSEKDMYGYEMIDTLRITDQGRKYLKSKLDEWETYSVAVANVLAPTGI